LRVSSLISFHQFLSFWNLLINPKNTAKDQMQPNIQPRMIRHAEIRRNMLQMRLCNVATVIIGFS
jgi:hypothetical protein